jgi:hypothetical protein
MQIYTRHFPTDKGIHDYCYSTLARNYKHRGREHNSSADFYYPKLPQKYQFGIVLL